MHKLLALVVLLIVLILLWVVKQNTSLFEHLSNPFSSKLNTVDIFAHGYFDHNATTRPSTVSITTYQKHLNRGNPHASYATESRSLLKAAEQQLLAGITDPGGMYLGDRQCIWTSGGSESINLMLRGTVNRHWLSIGARPHLILSDREHKTSSLCAMALARQGRADVTFLDLTGPGAGNRLYRAMRHNTALVSVIHINNETGDTTNLRDLAAACWNTPTGGIATLHVDAVQSIGKLPNDLWCAGAISFSAHKFGGPIGVGGLMVNPRLITAEISGTQNGGLRGGTENVPGILAACAALQQCWINPQWQVISNNRVQQIVTALSNIYEVVPMSQYQGLPENSSYQVAGTTNSTQIVFLGQNDGNTILVSFIYPGPLAQHFCNLQLRDYLLTQGYVVSTGSACNGNEPSPVLMAMRMPFIIRCGVIRISVSHDTTSSECSGLISAIQRFVPVVVS